MAVTKADLWKVGPAPEAMESKEGLERRRQVMANLNQGRNERVDAANYLFQGTTSTREREAMRYLTVKPKLEEEARGTLNAWDKASDRAYAHVTTRLAHRPDLHAELETRKEAWALLSCSVF